MMKCCIGIRVYRCLYDEIGGVRKLEKLNFGETELIGKHLQETSNLDFWGRIKIAKGFITWERNFVDVYFMKVSQNWDFLRFIVII